MTNGRRNYKRERQWEKDNGDRRGKERALRNAARKEAGLKVGDSRQADHKKPLVEGGSNSKKNIQVISKKANLRKEAQRKQREARK